MRLPAPLLRRDPHAHKNIFGHALILAGSRAMLGAPALCALAAMRTGAGLTTVGIPAPLNAALHKKLSPEIMTLPLPATAQQRLSPRAFSALKKIWNKFQAIAIGPGLTQHADTQRLILKIIESAPHPMVIDADALNALAHNKSVLSSFPNDKILTPHPKEMQRLTSLPVKTIQQKRLQIAKDFARQYNVCIVLKGHQTVVAAPDGKTSINQTGNSGMATAGSGDVLTGMITALLAQGIPGFEAACWGVRLHGLAGDLAAKAKTRAGMIATDIIDNIPKAIMNFKQGSRS